MGAERPQFTLYSRRGCHLCDEMIADLEPLQVRLRFGFEVVDVDSDAGLRARYGVHVPVLAHGEHELCRHALDPARLTDYLAKIG